ncbi:MAG: B12-binding domain-containing radical SAM protein [Spartobacteria bacterium]|nr:B12-binding domain-containing radical SAM protein [Spartobacteria bacterium]
MTRSRRPRILFIFPKWHDRSLWGHFRYKFPALGLLTIAGLTPDTFDIEFIDENCDAISFDADVDIVALSVMTPLAHRAYEIADAFRAKNKKVVMGGIHVSCMPDEALDHADAVIIGEGEAAWLAFLDDYQNGTVKSRYRTDVYSDLQAMPMARRELLHKGHYITTSSIQLTRGCPHNCEYCSVTALFGHKFRSRPLDEFVREYQQLPDRFVFIVDDNIMSNHRAGMELFARLKGTPKWWGSQVPITIGDDEEALKAMAACGCKSLFIGFESLNQDNLNQMGKKFVSIEKNMERIRRIQDHGIGIQGSFIVGCDYDTPAVFDEMHRFIDAARLEAFLISVLTPFPGIRLTQRLEKEGRILSRDWRKYDMNTVVYKPIHFTPDELQDGYYELNKSLYSMRSIVHRSVNFKKNMAIFVPQNMGFRTAWKKVLKVRHAG